MTGLVATVLNKIPASCIATGLNKEGCTVRLARTPSSGSRLIIDLDKPSSHWDANQGRRCDYLFFEEVPSNPNRVRPIELKKGGFDASVVKIQLQAGARVAERLIPTKFAVDFLPVLASESVPKAERKRMKDSVRFRNHYMPIRRIRCRDPLP